MARVIFERLPEAPYSVLIEDFDGKGGQRAHGHLVRGQRSEVDLVLPGNSARFKGTVISGASEPWRCAEEGSREIEFRRESVGGGQFVATASVTGDGTFEVGLPVGNYQSRVRAGSGAPWIQVSGQVEISGSNVTASLRLVGTRLVGAAYDGTLGGPYDRTRSGPLTIELANGSGERVAASSISSDGAYAFHGIPPGRYRQRIGE